MGRASLVRIVMSAQFVMSVFLIVAFQVILYDLWRLYTRDFRYSLHVLPAGAWTWLLLISLCVCSLCVYAILLWAQLMLFKLVLGFGLCVASGHELASSPEMLLEQLRAHYDTVYLAYRPVQHAAIRSVRLQRFETGRVVGDDD